MIGLCHLMAGNDSRMAGGESRMTGDCCRADSIQPDLYIDAYARIHTCTLIYIWPCGSLRHYTIKLLGLASLEQDDRKSCCLAGRVL